MTPKTPTTELSTPSRFGGQVSEAKAEILRYLQGGKRNRFDIAMHLNHGRDKPVSSEKLTQYLGSMVTAQHIVHIKDGVFDGYKIATGGRKAIGAPVPEEAYRPTRICNSMMPNCPDLMHHTHMGRVGLAVYGVAGR